LAKRARNLWRRPNGSFRLGQSKPLSSSNLDEHRITLYLPPYVLDMAEDQANRLGVSTVQEYCTQLLRNAIEDARRRQEIAEAEAKRKSLEGFNAITDDPEYLAEWSVSIAPHVRTEIQFIEGSTLSHQADAMPEGPSSAARTILRHAAVEWDDAAGFLATIRRGESVGDAVATELLQALNALEIEYREAKTLDRRVAYALHRLAFEGQVLHTDAWPGTLDQDTVNLLRSIQEAVDRVLSGEDIRYYPTSS
jgi:hypothetical protein